MSRELITFLHSIFDDEQAADAFAADPVDHLQTHHPALPAAVSRALRDGDVEGLVRDLRSTLKTVYGGHGLAGHRAYPMPTWTFKSQLPKRVPARTPVFITFEVEMSEWEPEWLDFGVVAFRKGDRTVRGRNLGASWDDDRTLVGFVGVSLDEPGTWEIVLEAQGGALRDPHLPAKEQPIGQVEVFGWKER